ncbi:hypothetical protein ACFWNK_15510 [Streptomyces sp. NPDC058417]|uniref:hypothetical protein n=1 Tax=unclassified Streptomyces TaxID=2593676 RepID=UPI00364E7084
MTVRFTTRARRRTAAVTVAVGLVIGVTACGGGGGGDDKPRSSASAAPDKGSGPSTQEGSSDTPLAEMKGVSGLLFQVTSAVRDAGGFVTVNGNLKNDGDKSVIVPAALRGNETEILKNGRSLGGATLVDPKGKKRYYVLRDTDGRPLTTTGFNSLKAGESLPVFLQFPAPPADTTEVTFQLPTFAAASIQISG